MATYSHSKISTFENCPYQYKLKYVDKLKSYYETGVEAFMGAIVHDVLELLHKEKNQGKILSKGDLFRIYNEMWEEKFSDKVLIARKGTVADDYRKMGMVFIRDYYDQFHPFENLKVIGLETQDRLELKDGSKWHIRIDKLCVDENGNYYVCDYKTNGRMKEQEEADVDRQLAMYSIWVKEKYKDAKDIKLVWHMLKFKETVFSERTDQQLEKLHDEIVEKIAKVEQAEQENDFPANVSKLCEWCLYQNQCSFYQKAKLNWEKKNNLF